MSMDKRRRPFRPITWISMVICFSALSFYVGVWTGFRLVEPGLQAGECEGKRDDPQNEQLDWKAEALAEKERQLKRRIDAFSKEEAQEEQLDRKAKALAERERQLEQKIEAFSKKEAQLEDLLKNASRTAPREKRGGVSDPLATEEDDTTSNEDEDDLDLLARSLPPFVRGIVRVRKDDLMRAYDFGVPPNPNTEKLDVLVVYNHQRAVPRDKDVARAARFEGGDPLPLLSAADATENCDTMNVLLTNNPKSTRQCLAIVGGQYQSYHVQRWMRVPGGGGKIDPNMPLRLTTRAHAADGSYDFTLPGPSLLRAHQQKLLTYLAEADGVRSRLKETLAKMGTKTVVVMTCNRGQSELLMNFVCSARSRGINLEAVLVFPTDLETKELAEGMGLASFYEEKLMASVPKQEARQYGDWTFTSVMFAKVLCVQLVNELGYDLLFQDADVVWYKDPLGFFRDASLPEFDVYFQDDGSRSERYAPYSANTGFYYARSNARTQHFFRHLIYAGDLISAWMSHQQVLIALLAEHSSTFGLGVKVFAQQTEEFPGGMHYHLKKAEMKRIMRGETNAYIFHMSWTTNKDIKLHFLQQMGEWYLNDQCVGKQAREIVGEGGEAAGLDEALAGRCCSAEPLVTCHYRDKPSRVPCPDSPPIDRDGKSFW